MKILCLIIDSTPHQAWQETYEVHRRNWNSCLDKCQHVDGYFLRSDPNLPNAYSGGKRAFAIHGEERLDTILHKTLRAIEVLLTDHDYVIRTNLSSIYDFPTLQCHKLPRSALYTGHMRHDQGWDFVSGSGMILSADVAKKLLRPSALSLKPYDDVAICQILDAQGVHPQPQATFIYDYAKELTQLPTVGQFVHYRLRDEADPHRVQERNVAEYLFNKIYGA